MTDRRKIIAGNWKLHKTREQAEAFLRGLMDSDLPNVEVMVAAGYLQLPFLVPIASKRDDVVIASQNVSAHREGPYTGEVSAEQLRSEGVKTTLVGHSERRHVFGESNAEIAKKFGACLRFGIRPVLCVGETLAQRQAGQLEEVLEAQLMSALAECEGNDVRSTDGNHDFVIAYEPVWAIGTGETATPEDAQSAHRFLRNLLPHPNRTCILYGGSVKPENAESLLNKSDIDGVLVGGASLELDSFLRIIHAVS